MLYQPSGPAPVSWPLIQSPTVASCGSPQRFECIVPFVELSLVKLGDPLEQQPQQRRWRFVAPGTHRLMVKRIAV